MGGWQTWARETLGPPVIGILFWMLAGLMVILSSVSTTNTILKDFLSGFGSIAQVAIAFAAWKLARDQSAMTRSFNERQLKLMAMPERIRLKQEYDILVRETSPQKVTDDSFETFIVFINNMRPIYSRTAMAAVDELVELVVEIADVKEGFGFPDDEASLEHAAQTIRLAPYRQQWGKASLKANRQLNNDLSLEPDGEG